MSVYLGSKRQCLYPWAVTQDLLDPGNWEMAESFMQRYKSVCAAIAVLLLTLLAGQSYPMMYWNLPTIGEGREMSRTSFYDILWAF